MERLAQLRGNDWNVYTRLLATCSTTIEGCWLQCFFRPIIALMSAGAFSRARNTQYGATNFASLGSIQEMGVHVYGGNLTPASNQTNQFLNWGIIYPGSQINRSFYMKSLSNQNITLDLKIINWNPPEMSKYMNLMWNYTQTLLKPSQTVYITLRLTVSSSTTFINYLIDNKIQGFNFDIDIEPT